MSWWPFGKKDTAGELPRGVEQIFEKVAQFLDDEAAQNKALPDEFRRAILQNPAVDQIKNGSGEFGRAKTNPIPVNGPIGQILYLSRLETINGTPVAFHRLGACDSVDVFEIVSADGRYWDILYLSLYFPRKSRALPAGYRVSTDRSRHVLFRGTTQYVETFPTGIFHATVEFAKNTVGLSIGDPKLKFFDENNAFDRPEKHFEELNRIKFTSLSETQIAAEQRPETVDELFDRIAELLKERIEKTAHDMQIRLGAGFERELTYVLLYAFTMVIFSSSRENPTTTADQLAQVILKRLASAETTSMSGIVNEYRARYAGYREIELFRTSDRVLVNEGALVLGRHLTGLPSMVFGMVVAGNIAEVLKLVRDGLPRSD